MRDLNSWKAYRSDLGGYMRRWIARCPFGTLRLHNILTSDEGRDFHDHPWGFTSLILSGGYVEHRPGCGCEPIPNDGRKRVANLHHDPGGCRYYGPGSVVRRDATDLHRLELVNGPAWTLVLTSPYHRMWGFQTADGWVDFKSYQRSFYRDPGPIL